MQMNVITIGKDIIDSVPAFYSICHFDTKLPHLTKQTNICNLHPV